MKTHVEELIEPEGKLMLRYFELKDELRHDAAEVLLAFKDDIEDALLLDEADRVARGERET
ncbi:hypothetical protein [Candidatus Magnetobacterium casense]|uniref:Uncharacterized protein n=1 Tax=Candidatus Magnetobacterium casense TaxID=1455061 RepID=A0ABS6S1Y1_9BACT|nr:hypothetical protein [Candidatus Magnetobacterium casensis]MBV6342821.1 hypothetical protein [Candidatus Magnetobacterium casensis]